MPIYARPQTFSLTTGAGLFGEQWPTGSQMIAFARSLERDLVERFNRTDEFIAGLHGYMSHVQNEQVQQESDIRLAAAQHASAGISALRAGWGRSLRRSPVSVHFGRR